MSQLAGMTWLDRLCVAKLVVAWPDVTSLTYLKWLVLYAAQAISWWRWKWPVTLFMSCCLPVKDGIILLLTYLLTLWSRILLEKLTGFQLVKKFPAFYGTRRFITTVKSIRHLSLSWASSIQTIPSHLTSWRSIVIWDNIITSINPLNIKINVNCM